MSPPINPAALIAILLLYVGLLPGSLSTGLTAVYYAFERAEVPAAVATAASINKVVLGLLVLLASLFGALYVKFAPRRGLAFVLMRKDGAVLLRKRPLKGLLGGMDEVPSSPWREGKLSPDEAMRAAPVPARWQILDGLVRHTFTHFHLELTVARAIATTGGLARLAPGTTWCTVDRMTERALPTVMRKVIAHAVRT